MTPPSIDHSMPSSSLLQRQRESNIRAEDGKTSLEKKPVRLCMTHKTAQQPGSLYNHLSVKKNHDLQIR